MPAPNATPEQKKLELADATGDTGIHGAEVPADIFESKQSELKQSFDGVTQEGIRDGECIT